MIYDNVISTPNLTVTNIEELENKKLRLHGNTLLGENSRYGMQFIKASINGTGFNNVTSIDSGSDYSENQTKYEFYHDFEPWVNNNGAENSWKERGYTLTLQAFSNNADEEKLFYFTPFSLNKVDEGVYPKFHFNVNKHQWDLIKNNIGYYEILTKKAGEDWQRYIQNIPPSAEHEKGTGVTASFDSQNGNIVVQSLTKQLPAGEYEVKVHAIDRWGKPLDSNTIKIRGAGVPSYAPSLPISLDWFPVQVNKITGVQSGIISSFATPLKSTFAYAFKNISLTGVASAYSKVTIRVTNADNPNQYVTYIATTNPDSLWTQYANLYTKSIVDVWAEDSLGKFNKIPAIPLAN